VTNRAQANGDAETAFKPLLNRGISREVIRERGYRPYYPGEHTRDGIKVAAHLLHDGAVEDSVRGFGLTAGQRAFIKRTTNQMPGLVIPKHPLPFAPPILPQFRPSGEVTTGTTTRHRHDRDFSDPDDLARHLEEEHEDWDVAPNAPHEHKDEGKYLFVPKANEPYAHDHRQDPRFSGATGHQNLARHLRRDHGLGDHDGVPPPFKARPADLERLLSLVEGEHGATFARKNADGSLNANYSPRHNRTSRDQHIADRIDILPRSFEHLFVAEELFFVIEGALKNDAIQTYIDEYQREATVCNVPSVTLWNAPELDRFAKLLSSLTNLKRIVIVPDADCVVKPGVRRQAIFLRERLRRRGLHAIIAAPPTVGARTDERGKPLECKCDPAPNVDSDGLCPTCHGFVKGVDDFLSREGDLELLSVYDIEARHPLALFADERGYLRRVPLLTLAKMLGVARDADRVLREIAKEPKIRTAGKDRPVAVRNPWSNQVEWKRAPTFFIPNQLRARVDHVPLWRHWAWMQSGMGWLKGADAPAPRHAVFLAVLLERLLTAYDVDTLDRIFHKGDIQEGDTDLQGLLDEHGWSLTWALNEAASRIGIDPETLRADPHVAAFYESHDGVRVDLARLLRAMGLKQQEIADLLRVSRSTVSRDLSTSEKEDAQNRSLADTCAD